MCQTPWLVYLCKKKKNFFLIFSTELFCFLWGLVMKTQCANPNIKSVLYNKPPPSQPFPEGQISVRTFGNWSTRNSSVYSDGLLIMSLSTQGRLRGSHAGIHISESPSPWKYACSTKKALCLWESLAGLDNIMQRGPPPWSGIEGKRKGRRRKLTWSCPKQCWSLTMPAPLILTSSFQQDFQEDTEGLSSNMAQGHVG